MVLPNLHPDFADLLRASADADVRFLVVDGYAVGFHDRPRTTKDLDLLLHDTRENVARTCRALGRPIGRQAPRTNSTEVACLLGAAARAGSAMNAASLHNLFALPAQAVQNALHSLCLRSPWRFCASSASTTCCSSATRRRPDTDRTKVRPWGDARA